ncbi:hypothetical protein ARMGADRAFT_224837 [Armillaria gallica]|uniref:Uncharacterized protein n=1 Tax=Armillaria gallica TaxID=47427 RepID=A0A2H3E2L7_ARMGA|nr:hypothetical protein ARMGADRAFT_224837 [Armillaria gallica]
MGAGQAMETGLEQNEEERDETGQATETGLEQDDGKQNETRLEQTTAGRRQDEVRWMLLRLVPNYGMVASTR